MKLTDYRKMRLSYQKKAKDREMERLNLGMGADEDVPHYAKVTDEILIDLIEKVQHFESLMRPAPVEKGENVPTTRLKLG